MCSISDVWCGMVFLHIGSVYAHLFLLPLSGALEEKDEGTLRASCEGNWNFVKSPCATKGEIYAVSILL